MVSNSYGLSGLSNPTNFIFVSPPTIEIYPTTTLREVAFIYGSLDPILKVEILENGQWNSLHDDFYLVGGKFVFPFILKSGNNSVQLRSTDGDKVSSAITVEIEKIKKSQVRFRKRNLFVNGIDMGEDNLIGEVGINTDLETGITQITFEVQNIEIEKYDNIEFFLDDGLKTSSYKGVIKSGKVVYGLNGSKSAVFMAQSENDSLPRLLMSSSLTGLTNGEVLTQIFKKAGFINIYVPDGGLYVGARTISNQKVYDTIVKKIVFIESWNIIPFDSETIIINPTRCSKYVDWTFNDSQIITLGDEFDTTMAINQLHIAYEPIEDDLNINYQLGENVPDKSDEPYQENAFFKSDMYEEEIDNFSSDSVIFFGMWGSKTTDKNPSGERYDFDWENVEKARLVIKFNNAGGDLDNNTGGSLLTYNIDLDVFPEKKLAVGYYDLRMNHLNPNVIVYTQFVMIDKNGHYLGDPLKFSPNRLDNDTLDITNFEEILYRFGIQMSEVKKLATFEKSWKIKSVEDLPKDTEENIFISRYDKNGENIDCTFYVSCDLDDAVVETLSFDFANAGSNYNRAACLLNTSVIIDENQLLNGNKYIYGVKAHKPNKPIRRVDKVLFKFRSKIKIGDTIGLKFNIWGREFISSAEGWEDYSSINIVETNQNNIDFREGKNLEPALIDGGTILSGFISSEKQAREKVRRVLFAQDEGYLKRSVSTPGFSEMQPGQLVRLFNVIAGKTYQSYAFITSCNPNGSQNLVELVKTKPIILSEEKVEPYASDLKFNMSDIIKQLSDEITQFEIGTVLARKYRGTYSVKMDSGVTHKYVVSRVLEVKSEDRVGVVQIANGNYVIIEVIRPSLIDSDMEDLLAPTDKDYEEWEKEIKDKTSNTFEKYPSVSGGRPMGNLISIGLIEAETIYEGLVPYKGSSFKIHTSHDCESWAISQDRDFSSSFERNLGNFVFVQIDNGYVRCETIRIAPNIFRVVPQDDLPFGAKIIVGMAPVNYEHPYWGNRGVVNGEWNLNNIQNNATLQGLWTHSFTVQPELKVDITFKGTTYIEIESNQALDKISAMTNDNYFIETIE